MLATSMEKDAIMHVNNIEKVAFFLMKYIFIFYSTRISPLIDERKGGTHSKTRFER